MREILFFTDLLSAFGSCVSFATILKPTEMGVLAGSLGIFFERNGVSGVVDRRPVYGQGFWGLVHKGGYLVFSGHVSCSSVLSHEFVLMLLSRSFSMHFPDDIRYV